MLTQRASESQPKLFRGLFADKAHFTMHSNDAIHFIVYPNAGALQIGENNVHYFPIVQN